ncbi:MAG TPA: protein-glutamate O-methyltransferase CheR [Steroidobacteraceae bacterium]|jgi:chemotaxis protein methyltransferase CheR|nr:protein-glutamate O-methyltransferase CheR [Steroidobacteraceae bacterium]
MSTSATTTIRALGDFALSRSEFERLRELVREHTGIALSDAKRQLVYGRLARRLRALKLESFAEYIKLIERGEPAELEEFVNAVTTNLTSFFREPHHFEYLGRELLPDVAARSDGTNRLRIWCCAASTGEEPYSIAMVLREAQAHLAGWDVKMLATDLDSAVLATAAAGIYTDERFKGMDPKRMSRFFEKGVGAQDGKFRVREELRSLITFRQLNLMHEWPMRGPFDAIFCRNVIIYFDKATQRTLFERMAALQRPGDFLFLGHSESLYRVSDRYELIGRTVYRRLED